METKHTPWQVIRRLSDLQSGVDLYVGIPDRREAMNDYSLRYAEQHIAQVFNQDEETAAFICTAVNAHEDLLAALRATLPALERLGDFVGNVDNGGASGLGIIDRCLIIRQVRDAVDRAIGKKVTS